MYAFALIFFTGTPLLLGSLWGLAWLVYYAPVLMARSLGEEALLRAQLPGYDAYTQRVRYRFAPGLW
jgi:protein-S-isoprenylcysteine O-methyltransferase Ste14